MESDDGKIIVELAADRTREKLVSRYKTLLQEYINRRPSGTRIKIARALDKNKSFVSQITNPGYTIPIPARHLNTIFEICRFSIKERETFLKAYTEAHTNYQYRIEPSSKPETGLRKLVIEIPILDDPDKQNRIEEMIRDYARKLFLLVQEE